ncbi:MAG: DUF1800 domain-containing protein [Pseudomonadales bacterium]|nr:DUF1800 domain-containing protein [Pseudomonadales bacterium]
MKVRFSLLLLALMSTLGCSGGGSGSDSGSDSGNDNSSNVGVTQPSDEQRATASRFLSQASLGGNMAMIDEVARIGMEGWIDAQMQLAPTYHLPQVDALIETYDGNEDFDEFMFRRYIWWHNAMTARDQLRHRVALALSEIFVISDRVDELEDPTSTSGFFDVLLTHAFGSYEDLLLDVSLHPAMGIYLSHVNNRKAIPEQGIFPDENYAREVMQLFSIGLYELNEDGTRKLDGNSRLIPTYGNQEITEMAKVFTGLSYGSDDAFFGNIEPEFFEPMQMFESYHDVGEKRLLNGYVIPTGQSGLQDIRDAISHLSDHPNTGPFIARRLIQRLVTSNPSPDYIQRVAQVFANNGNGERGDLGAVIKAILMDVDAIDIQDDPGRLQAPMLRFLHAMRGVGLKNARNRFYSEGFELQIHTKQHPLSAPSVFNFYLPDYQPNGEISNAQLVAPEFQISTDTTVIGLINLMRLLTFEDEPFESFEPNGEITLDLDDEVELAEDPVALVDHCNLVFAHNSFSESYKNTMLTAINSLDDREERARMAIFLSLISPEYAVIN